MVTKCVVPNCGNSCNTKLSVTLFSFPKDPHLAQTWLKLTRAHGVKNIKSHHKVCSKHFERRVIQDHFGATRLEPGAIPTIFEWNNDDNLRSSPFVTDRNPYLSFNEIVLPPPNHRLLLPKTPKVGIPPIVKRVSTDTKSPTLDLFKKKALLGCDVILPDRRVISYKKPSIKTRENKYEREEAAIEDIHRLSQDVFPVKTTVSGLQVSDDDSNGSRHVGHHIEEYEENSLIEEINDPLHTDIDAHLVSRDGEILDKTAEEIIIEECCVIEDEIIPPERANDTLSPLFFLNNVEDVKRVESTKTEPPEPPLSSFGHIEEKSPPELKGPSSPMGSSPKGENLGSSDEPPHGIVFLQFDTQTGTCTENPDLNDLSQEELGKIKRSLSTSSKVVILKKSNQVDKELGRMPCKPEKTELPTKLEDSKKTKVKAIQAKRTVAACGRIAPKSEAKKPPLTLRDGTTASSSEYFIPRANTVKPLLSPMVLPKPQTQPPQQNSAASTVAPAQNVGSFLIATAPSTPLANKSAQGPQVVGPMLLQIGNVALPVTSSLGQGKPVQSNAVNLVSPQMTYLIPFGGALSSPLPITSRNSSTNAGKLLISRNNQNVVLSPGKPASCSPPKKRRRLTKEFQKLECEDHIENGASSGRNASACTGSNQEESLTKRLSEAEFELRRKSLCIKELRRDKMRLSVKLKLLQKAFGKLRKASILTLSTAKLLEAVDPNAQLDAKDLRGRRSLSKLDSFVGSVHFASKRLYDHFRSELVPEEEQTSYLVEEEPPDE